MFFITSHQYERHNSNENDVSVQLKCMKEIKRIKEDKIEKYKLIKHCFKLTVDFKIIKLQ